MLRLSLYIRALSLWEKALGPEHPNVAASLNSLANIYREEATMLRLSLSTSALCLSGRKRLAQSTLT